MVLLPGWLPSDRLTEPAIDLVSDSVRDAALETATLALESELRYCFDVLGIDAASVSDLFDQARYEARLHTPSASVFESRHRAALDMRVTLRELCVARLPR